MYYTLIEALSVLIFLIPSCLVQKHLQRINGKRTVLYLLFSLYLAAVYLLTGLPTVLFTTFDVHMNLVPRDIFGKELVLSLLNISMFIPLGFFLPLLWKKYRKLKNTLLFGLAATVAIEAAQLFTYRATDINDVITNFLGAFSGYLLFLPVQKYLPKDCLPEQKTAGLRSMIAITAAGMFFVQPLIAALLYKLT